MCWDLANRSGRGREKAKKEREREDQIFFSTWIQEKNGASQANKEISKLVFPGLSVGSNKEMKHFCHNLLLQHYV